MIRSDEQIKKDIVDELYWDSRIDASKISVTVEDGIVSLAGEVPTYGDLSAARAAALTIGGVVDLVDNLRVSLVPPQELPGDLEIEDRANHILIWDRAIDEAHVRAVADRGIVTLEGTVDAYWKKYYAEERIEGILGILGIENRLSVVPTMEATDEKVGRDIVRALERDELIDPDAITVEVENGIATLSGRAPNTAARLAAWNDASRTPGVVDVRNNIAVAGRGETV